MAFWKRKKNASVGGVKHDCETSEQQSCQSQSKTPRKLDESSKRGPSLSSEQLESRILLSATWVDADSLDDLDDATGGDDIYTGDDGDNFAFAGAGDDHLFGGLGDDVLGGGDGNDVIVTGTGNDIADGGAGDDIFVVTGQHGDVVHIDGSDGHDTIDLRSYSADQVTESSGTLTVDLGDGESFQIVHNSVESVLLGGDDTADAVLRTFTDSDDATQFDMHLASTLQSHISDSTTEVTVAGLPQGASLSNGTANPDGSWTLQPDDLDDVHLVLPPDADGTADLSITVHSSTGDNFDGTISTSNYASNDSGFQVSARNINADGSLSEASIDRVSSSSDGLGVSGHTGGPDSQLGYDAQRGVSEELVFSFDNDVTTATVEITRLFANEGPNSGEEAGHWAAYKDGVLVQEASFMTGSGSSLSVNIDVPGGFDELVFTAEQYSEGQEGVTNDSSDYLVKSIEFHGPTASEEQTSTVRLEMMSQHNANSNDNVIVGTNHNDTLHGGDGSDMIYGGDGDDVIEGDGGTESVVVEVGDLGASVTASDQQTGTGYIMYSAESVHTRFNDHPVHNDNADHFVTVKNIDGKWYYDDNSAHDPGSNPMNALHEFTPGEDDLLVASLDFDNDTVTSLEGTAGTVDGIESGFASSDLGFIQDQHGGGYNDGEVAMTGTHFVRNGAGEAGNDTIHAGAGNDTVYGNDGDDVITGGTGNDQLFAGAGNDTVSGDEGSDTIYGNSGDDVIDGGDGDDVIYGDDQSDGGYVAVGDLGASVTASDQATGTGYIMYSAENVHTRFSTVHNENADHFVTVKNIDGQWYYDNNEAHNSGADPMTGLVAFTPSEGDVLIAELDFDNDIVTSLEGTAGAVDGIELGYASGDLGFIQDQHGGSYNDGEVAMTGTHFVRNGTVGGNDTIEGGAGNDTMSGGGGDDTFTFTGAEDGDVKIIHGGSGNDTADLAGYSSDDITYRAGELVVHMADGGEFTIQHDGIETLHFDDGDISVADIEEVQSMTYSQFNSLEAGEVRYLTTDQMESIPNDYYMGRIPSSIRAEFTTEQIQAVDTADVSIGYLTSDQIGDLTVDQIHDVTYDDFDHLHGDQISSLTTDQVASIPNNYYMGRIPSAVRAEFTAEQVQAIDTEHVSIGYLTSDQIDDLTVDQIHDVTYDDFDHLHADQIPNLTTDQVASIPNNYYMGRIPSAVRAEFTTEQVQAINTDAVSIGYLTSDQIGDLTVDQIHDVTYDDFDHLHADQIPNLTTDQVASIPNNYYMGRIPSGVRAEFTTEQVQAINTDAISIGYLTESQRTELTTDQIQSLSYGDFRYVPADRIPELTTDQIASIPNNYYFGRFNGAQQAALTHEQIEAIDSDITSVVSTGTDVADALTDGVGISRLEARDGDDTLTGGAGNDVLIGGEGTDTAVYSGSRADYSVTRNDDGSLMITDLRDGSPDGTDLVRSVEQFQFADQTFESDAFFNAAPHDITIDNATISENAQAGDAVGQVTVSDADANDSHTFQLMDDADGRFEIDASGTIRVADGASFDFETDDALAYNVTVRAIDQAGAEYDETVTIQVADANEPPIDIGLSNITVTENASGADLGVVSITDVDAGDAHTISVSDDRFEVVESSDGLHLKVRDDVSFDHETEPSVSVTLTATDASGATYAESFTLEITDVNEAPVSIELTSTTISENASGTDLGVVSITDVDAGDAHTISVSDDRFEVVESSDGLHLKVRDDVWFDHETEPSVSVTLTATDASGAIYAESFTLEIADVNEAIETVFTDTLTVDENPLPGTVVGTIRVSDPDQGETHRFEMVDDANGNFEVDPNTGEVRVAEGASLDFEESASQTIAVRVTDSAGNAHTQQLNIEVNDIPETFASEPPSQSQQTQSPQTGSFDTPSTESQESVLHSNAQDEPVLSRDTPPEEPRVDSDQQATDAADTPVVYPETISSSSETRDTEHAGSRDGDGILNGDAELFMDRVELAAHELAASDGIDLLSSELSKGLDDGEVGLDSLELARSDFDALFTEDHRDIELTERAVQTNEAVEQHATETSDEAEARRPSVPFFAGLWSMVRGLAADKSTQSERDEKQPGRRKVS
ncbi:MAG: cadherin domain-containing protein [Phycisphaerales bacterium]|nr:cadherin domain-containing protein [Phycisphaerales bacterium]